MKPSLYINVFAAIAAFALCMHVASDFWLPLLIGAVLMAVLLLRR